MSTGELRTHASVYMQGLRDVVASLYNNSALVAELKKIASSHRRRNVERYHIMVISTIKAYHTLIITL